MIILTVILMAVVMFLLWNHTANACFDNYWDYDAKTTAYIISLLLLITVLIYFSQ